MGVPLQTLICASNVNNVLTDFFTTGKYDLRDRHLEKSISPSIDILKSSNLERFLFHTSNDGALVKKLFQQLTTEKHFEVWPLGFKLRTLFILDSSVNSGLFFLEV